MGMIKPTAGMVLRYGFLYAYQVAEGLTYNPKKRPCLIISTKQTTEGLRVMVAPISHNKPHMGKGLRIPRPTADRIGLDEVQSWLCTNELNLFAWPSRDVDYVPGRETPIYGFVPSTFWDRAKTDMLLHRENATLQLHERKEHEMDRLMAF